MPTSKEAFNSLIESLDLSTDSGQELYGSLIILSETFASVMDEFDDSFHLSLTKALLNIINSESNKNQFIFTTHNLNLLDSNLRVDQIYLMEKDFMGKTDVYSLFDFNELKGVSRSDISFAKRYLNGQFGALPDIDVEGMDRLFKEIK